MVNLKSVLNNKRNYFTFIDGIFYFSIKPVKFSINWSMGSKLFLLQKPNNSNDYNMLHWIKENAVITGIGMEEKKHFDLQVFSYFFAQYITSSVNEMMEYNHYYIGKHINKSNYVRFISQIMLLNMNILNSIQRIKVNKSDGNITCIDGYVTDKPLDLELADGDHDIVCCKFDGYQDDYYFLLDETYITVDEINKFLMMKKINQITEGEQK